MVQNRSSSENKGRNAVTNYTKFKQELSKMIEDYRADFEQENNPVFAWRAIYFACILGGEFPDWLRKYLSTSAEAIVAIHEDAKEALPVPREAQRVGRAVGFVSGGKGATSHFEKAALLERARKLHSEVVSYIEKGDKTYIAQQNVADSTGWPLHVVKWAYVYIEKPNQKPKRKPKN
jgi:hypothetical protein